MAIPALTIPVGIDLAAFEKGMEVLNALTRQSAKSTLEQYRLMNVELAKSSQTLASLGSGATGKKPDAEAKGTEAVKKAAETRPLLDFIKEAQAVDKALENAAVKGLKSFETGIIGVVMGTKTLKQAFSEMAKGIAEDLMRIAIRRAITGPIANGLLGAFGGNFVNGYDVSLTGGVNPFPLPIGSNAEGTDSWRGGLTWVGERGPELLNLPRGAQIIPNDVVRHMGGGVTAPVAISIDARGADQAGLARLQQQLAKLEISLPYKIRQVVQDRPNTRW
jgi:hypothetical protein